MTQIEQDKQQSILNRRYLFDIQFLPLRLGDFALKILMPSEILANVIRGETVESIHRGHLIVIDGDGNTIASVGDPSTVTYFRSSAKAFQAIPFITSGAADAFGFTDDEIALAVASHSGEPMHVEIAARMLAKIGLSESDLRCGAHLPFNEAERMLRAGETPTQLHNNCSGKHAAMLAFAKHIEADIETYDSPDNRIQKRILKCVSDFTEVPEDEIAIGIDGCARQILRCRSPRWQRASSISSRRHDFPNRHKKPAHASSRR